MTNGELLGKKLYELRKNANLSQEEFAEKLNVSRQAVSKWECGDALPDTENLIKISKLYGVSLDELVGNTPPKQNRESEEPEQENNDPASPDDINVYVDSPSAKHAKKAVALRLLMYLPYPIIITIAYLLWGFLWNGWAIGWTLYVTVPVYYSILECIRKKKASCFAYPALITFIYLFVGMQWGYWHPNWLLFVTIPIYYAIAEAIEKR